MSSVIRRRAPPPRRPLSPHHHCPTSLAPAVRERRWQPSPQPGVPACMVLHGLCSGSGVRVRLRVRMSSIACSRRHHTSSIPSHGASPLRPTWSAGHVRRGMITAQVSPVGPSVVGGQDCKGLSATRWRFRCGLRCLASYMPTSMTWLSPYGERRPQPEATSASNCQGASRPASANQLRLGVALRGPPQDIGFTFSINIAWHGIPECALLIALELRQPRRLVRQPRRLLRRMLLRLPRPQGAGL